MFKRLVVVLALVLLVPAGAARAQSNYPVRPSVQITDCRGHDIGTGPGVKRGERVCVRVTLWKARTDVRAEFFSDPILLGTYQTDSSGVLDFSFNVPDVRPGQHTIRLTGIGSDNQPRVVEGAIKVRADNAGGSDHGRSLDSGSADTARAFGNTGANIVPILEGGFALFAIGAALVLAVRKRRTADAFSG